MTEHHSHHAHAEGGDGDDIALCPVMPGSTITKAEAEEEGLVRDYNGARYYLCCADCASQWDADPARYAEA